MEENRFIRYWIWFWYNDITRLCVIIGVPVIPITIMVHFFFGPGEHLRYVSACAYLLIFAWAMLDNDYSNLRRIGMDEYRRKLNKEKQNASKS